MSGMAGMMGLGILLLETGISLCESRDQRNILYLRQETSKLCEGVCSETGVQ